ncbi:hypothetical protein CF68_33225 [Cupriavidus sp. SK-4]|uniref:hypothetical protein n=1 Tax=Cupriavidus sp. SK-4 TaxID=574750 RepID=UPI000451583F|nr:hypothetical protein [Cupriavidus sp. SK-4]EYS89543.1 hypothetical protein CF68_33225 [Cupriavidus sp. SK-4]
MTRRIALIDIWKLPLRQQAMKREELRHSARLKELKKIDAQLALLEAEHAAIKEAGYTISGAEIGADALRGGLSFLPTAILKGDNEAFRALVGAGFSLVDRSEGAYRIVTLTKGRLKISMGLTAEALEQLTPEAKPTTEAA